MEKNNELRTAWEFVENTGQSIFLTGKAGTGKTTFLKTVVERSHKRSVVVAPTGVAAINAGGVTIHSFFQLPLSPFVPGATTKTKFDFSKEKRKIIASLDLLIIDEISMVRSDLLDAIDAVLRRFRDHLQPFGGLQLLMIGDLGQLTPVVTPEDEQMLKPYYETPYFFGSKALSKTDYVTIQLETVYRQQDTLFLGLLNHIRQGHPTASDLTMLNSRYQPTFIPHPEEGYIRLTTHNQLANFYNENELHKLPGRPFTFSAKIEGAFPDYAYPTAETLILKKGAQVMFVKNDPSGKHRYYNGRIGQVTYVDDKRILVLCQGDKEAIDVEPIEWENTRYILNPETREIVTDVQGTFLQYPLRLAWAITIHKSQGLTFNHAIIDANQSFAPGQVYVALSRCRTLEGLVLATPIEARAIINDQQVDIYIEQQEKEAFRSISQLQTLKEEYHRKLLLELFNFSAIENLHEQLLRLFADYFYHSHTDLMQLHNHAHQQLQVLVTDVARKWTAKISLMTTSELHEPNFLSRVQRSAAYFADTLEALLDKPIRLTAELKPNNKQAATRLQSLLPELRQTWLARRYLLTKMVDESFSVNTYLHQKQISMLDALDENMLRKKKENRQKKKEKQWIQKEPTGEISLRLFRQSMTVEQIAQERSLTVNTVFNHLATFVKKGQLSLSELVSDEKQQVIRKVINAVGTEQGLISIKALCPQDISYQEIRLVIETMNTAT